ncbi:unnamed protein product, partial [Rotaria sp. Silwood1]
QSSRPSFNNENLIAIIENQR